MLTKIVQIQSNSISGHKTSQTVATQDRKLLLIRVAVDGIQVIKQ